MPTDEEIRRAVDEVTRHFNDQGKLIEAGFAAFRIIYLQDKPVEMIRHMRVAYFCGAQHLLASIMGNLEEGTEPTDTDLRRMDLIHAELTAFVASLPTEDTIQ